jgi:anaerobic magnesium-protoporphyrin IX monomethyl ester cyclase
MNVLLTHGYFLSEDAKEQEIMRPYPPLGILYIAAYLKEKQVNVTVFDTTFRRVEELKAYVRSEQPAIIAFYVNLMTKLQVIHLTQWLRSEPQLKQIKIVFGGPDITHNTHDYLKIGADAVVIGEGEETMHDLVNSFSRNLPLETVNGIAFLNHEGVEVKTPARFKIKDIDGLPLPDRAAIDLNQYIETWKKHHGSGMISISTQRGCPYTCKWCSTAVYGQSYRRRSPKLVVDEIETLLQTYACNTFWFVDDVFTVSHKWLEEFTTIVEERQLKFNYECISRADRMNETVIDLLKRSGCFKIWIGAESGSQKIIDAMDRRVDVMKVRNIIQQTQANGILAGTFIMLGYPGETKADIQETITHLKEANPHHFTITIAYPIKGTSLYTEIEQEQIHALDWASTTDRDRDFKRIYPRRFYEIAVKRVVNEVQYFQLKTNGKHRSPNGLKKWLKYTAAKWMMRWY